MLSFEEVLARKTANTRKVPVVLDGAWGTKLADLERAVDRLREAGMDTLGSAEWAELSAELERMRDEAPKHSVEFVVKAISNDRYERLVASHPPTPDQRAEAKRRGQQSLPYNTDTFPAALLAASVIDPDTGEPWATDEQWQVLWTSDEWNTRELEDLFTAALEMCHTRPVVPPSR